MGGDFFFRLPSLGLLKVAALTPPDWHLTIIDEKVETLDLNAEADLVGITAMTTTVTHGYALADHFRRRGIAVVMGGMHVSQLPEEALQHCDAVVVGEAENLWSAVLADFEQRRLRRLYGHENGLPALDSLPLPDWTLYRPKKYLPVHFVETTRGCPLDCEFCSVTNAFGGSYRNRPVEQVLAELSGLRRFEGFLTLKDIVFFVDDNIVGNRAYARELFARLADLKIRWFGQASVNIANDPQVLQLCQKSGCAGIFIGFESLSTKTLAEMGKRVNRPQNYLELVKRIHDHGIGIDGSFVFGFDTDDDGVFDRTLEFTLRAKLEVAYFSILTPYPGTRLYNRLAADDRILTRDWTLYDANHVVYRPRPFTPDRLLDGYYATLRSFYACGSILKRLWGSRSYKNFFYPMNFGFQQSVRKLYRAYEQGTLRIPTSAPGSRSDLASLSEPG